jgi:hypothetical protein
LDSGLRGTCGLSVPRISGESIEIKATAQNVTAVDAKIEETDITMLEETPKWELIYDCPAVSGK